MGNHCFVCNDLSTPGKQYTLQDLIECRVLMSNGHRLCWVMIVMDAELPVQLR
jgi:hypothetical protein